MPVTRRGLLAMAPAVAILAHSIDDPRSIWVVVDKHRPLKPLTYVPPDLVAPAVLHTNAPLLRKEAAAAVVRMFAGAEGQGVRLVSTSTYRSYDAQKQILAADTAASGAAHANTLDMRPGYSEHQTGWAIDIGSSTRPAVDFDGARMAVLRAAALRPRRSALLR